MPASNRKLIDLSGQVFGRLRALGEAPRIGQKKYPDRRWHCKCSCGKVLTVIHNSLVSGHTQSCGCLRSEIVTATYTKHGMTNEPEYNIWQLIKARCFKPENKSAKNYLERGITVCQGWLDFPTFFADVGRRPRPELTIDRRDNDGNYSCGHCLQCLQMGWPMNVRWATRKEQANNTRRQKAA